MDKINLSIDEAAFFLGYKKSYLYRLTASQKIPFSKPNNGKIFFDKEKLEEWVLRNNERKENKKTDLNATVFSTIMNAMKIINLSEKKSTDAEHTI